ncbi:Mu transposase domain-containing protein [Streptomyces sp. NPDC055632]
MRQAPLVQGRHRRRRLAEGPGCPRTSGSAELRTGERTEERGVSACRVEDPSACLTGDRGGGRQAMVMEADRWLQLRRFEVAPGAQTQVDWGDEGRILAHLGIPEVHSFHMVLSSSRDPFYCFTTTQDLMTFRDYHRRAFAHFGGAPKATVHDRTKTVVRRHVAPGGVVPLHPEAVAFAGHYDFDIDVLAAYRPTGKGRVERQVSIVRDHVLAGRASSCLEELDAAFTAWVPMRRARTHRIHRTHRTHGEVIGARTARDHAALRPLPPDPYVVADRHLRHVGKDCLAAFDSNLYSVPARNGHRDPRSPPRSTARRRPCSSSQRPPRSPRPGHPVVRGDQDQRRPARPARGR